ncbi:MAG TPA: serine hydrolase [Gemmataceae bacterium]|jgi:CubicO group peptidase (beta-lactamase class C family)
MRGASLLLRWMPSLVALLFLSPSARAEPFNARAVDDLIERALEHWHVPGVAVAIVRGEDVIYLKGHGPRSVAAEEEVTPDTLFPIASCTKSFTTAAMALLVDEGKMSWDDRPRKYIPYFRLSDPLADREVTLRDLVTHRIGLRGHDMLWYRSPWTQEDIIRRVGRLPLDKPFRAAFQYQSTMFTAAGFAVASASGTSWADFVRNRLLEPLDMKSVYFTTKEIAGIADKASPHRLDEKGRPKRIKPYPMDVPEPAGSIQASAAELSKWLRFQLNNKIVHGKPLVSERNLEAMHTPQIVIPMDAVDRATFPGTHQMSYGMGWVIQDHFGHRLLQHAGAIDGFRCHFTLVPKERVGIVLLCNLDQTRMNLALSNALLDVLLRLPPRDWNKIVGEAEHEDQEQAKNKEREDQKRQHVNTHPSRELGAYTGNFEHPAYGTVRITLEEGALVWHWNRFTAPLTHFHYDTFTLPILKMGEPHVVFTLDERGTVARMKVKGEMDVEFKRSR